MRYLSLARAVFELILVITTIVLAVRLWETEAPKRGSVIFSVPVRQKVVALTFDDGPHPTFTPEILAVLDKYHVKATFFMIGERMQQYPQIVKQVLTRGHTIGNHTYTHPHNIEAERPAQIIRELDMCEQVIERMTGKRACLFRPPLGLVNGTVVTIAEEEGYRTILWTVSADHHDAPTPRAMAERVLKRVRPGAIILAHDGTFKSRWKDVAALPLIIEALRKQGYKFVTVPELLELGTSRRHR
jgi:peptidoglycan/xylan/chitin deacetylase (PgdA/CDA1 family)